MAKNLKLVLEVSINAATCDCKISSKEDVKIISKIDDVVINFPLIIINLSLFFLLKKF